MKTPYIAALISSTVFLSQLAFAQLSGSTTATGTPQTSGSGAPTGTVNTNQRTGNDLNNPDSSANGRESVSDASQTIDAPPPGCNAMQQRKAKKGSKCFVAPGKKNYQATGATMNPRNVQAGTPRTPGTGPDLNKGSGTPSAESVGR